MNLIKQKGLLGIDKEGIDALLAEKKFIGLNRSPRAEEVIVSLTSYDKRINDVKYTIYSLLNQTFPPDKLILWLDEDSFPQREENLPRDLLEFRNFGLTIDWCENLSSYKKLIPALEKYPDNIIVTADDDLFYHPDWLKVLYEEHLKNPDCIIAHRCRRVKFDAQGNISPYGNWPLYIKSLSPYYGNFFTGAGGVLYSKKFFHKDILRRDIFKELTPLADDIWFWSMSVLNGTKIKPAPFNQTRLIYVDPQRERSGETLWSKNKTQNDTQFQNIIKRYPAVLETLIREAVTAKPDISVIFFLKDGDNLDDFIKIASKQKFIDFEVVVISIGSRIEIPNPPTNFKIIHYPGSSEIDAFNLGLQEAAGKYILFQDANSTLAYNSLEVISKFIGNSRADVIHFTGHIGDGKFVRDDNLAFKHAYPIFFEETKQNRAAFWLQGKLNNRIATKIFNREFLTQHKINFEDGLAEFMFQALIYAERYLLVPQAFCKCKD